MAVVTGFFFNDPRTGAQYPTSFTGRFYAGTYSPRIFNGGEFLPIPTIGVLTRTRPQPPISPAKEVTGFFKPGVFEQFWLERLHILPVSAAVTDLGNLVSDVDTVLEVFNASRLIPVDIATLLQTNADGFTIVSGPLPPFSIPPYNGQLYTIRAEIEAGPPTINASFTWTPSTSGFAAVIASFIGNRISIFTFEPQVEPVTRFEFITAIIESYNGTEQRSSTRQNPRMSIDYELRKGGDDSVYGTEAQALEHSVFDSLGRTYAVPVWEDREVLTANVSINDTVINVNTVIRDFRVGELLLLWKDWNDFEAQEISSVTATTVTVASPFLNAFTIAETEVLPSFLGFLSDGTVQEVFRLNYALWRMRFSRKNNISYEDAASPELPADFEGLPLWPKPWDIKGDSVGRQWRRNVDRVDTDVGKIEQAFRLTVPRRANSQIVVNINGRADFESFRQFLFALRGRQKAFWLPSFTSNFALFETATAGGTTIRVQRNSYVTLVTQRAPLNKIQVVLNDGRVFRHTIISSADVGSDETDLGVSPGVGEASSPRPDYTLANVARIEYLTKHRLDTDVLEFRGRRPRDDYELAFPIVEVINE